MPTASLPSLVGSGFSSSQAWMRWATVIASSSSVSGSTTRNSSPPKRAQRSYVRSSALKADATTASAASPSRWPKLLLISRRSSMSHSSTDIGFPSRRERANSARAGWSMPRVLSSPVLWSVSACSRSVGSASARWISTSGSATTTASAHEWRSTKPRPTPTAATTPSWIRASSVKRPLAETSWPRASRSIRASNAWLTSTNVTAAADATSTAAVVAEGVTCTPYRANDARTDHAVSALSTTFATLKPWMNHGYRWRSHSGTCWRTQTTTTSSGGSTSAATTENASPVWKTWFPAVWVANSWASAPATRMVRKTVQRTWSYDTVDVTAAATTAAATVA